MITPFSIYLIMRLDSIKSTLTGMSALFSFIGFIALVAFLVSLDSESETCLKVRKICSRIVLTAISIVIFCIVSHAFVPSTKEAAAIVLVPKIVNSEFVQETLPKESKELYFMAKEYLKEKIEEAKQKKDK